MMGTERFSVMQIIPFTILYFNLKEKKDEKSF